MANELKYKLLVSDMDGTFLDSNNQVGELTHKAITDYIDAGGHFAFCSGREVESLIWQAKEMKLPQDKITFMGLNGCVIVQNGKVIRHCDLPKKVALDITEYLNTLGVYYQIYDQNGMFVKEVNDICRWYCATTHCSANEVGDLHAYAKAHDLNLVKILIAASENDINVMSGYLPQKFSEVQWFKSCPVFYEAAAHDGGKGNALKFLADKCGINIASTASVGDSQNDLSMIIAAGTGVAVANAEDEIKNAADLVLEYSNNQDAVGRFIRSFLK